MIIEGLDEDVHHAARKVAAKWQAVELEDLKQDLWERILNFSEEAVRTLRNLPQEERRRRLTRQGHQIASAYRDQDDLAHGRYYYSTKQVRDMLDAGALLPDYATQQLETSRGGPGARGVLDIGTDVAVMDLRAAVGKLSQKQAHLLWFRYVEGNEPEGHPMYLKRAVDALTRKMNRMRVPRREEEWSPFSTKNSTAIGTTDTGQP